MFVMRQNHLEAFEAGYRDTFEDHMVQHVAAKFPTEYEELGEERVRGRIEDGIKRAERYEICAQPDVARFIRFMFAIRPDFDTSRKTAWAQPILEDTSVPAAERLDRIREEARAQRRAARQ